MSRKEPEPPGQKVPGSPQHMKQTYTKQHYIDQERYITGCFQKGKNHGLKEIVIDNFAGGGGASVGIEMATGHSVYAAINHDPEAVRMHMANHPHTKHYCESVWDVDPLEVCNGKPVGLAWFSPDCKHFSKAKGGKPKDKTIRGLAWVALRWAGLVRPRVIMLENVEEFKTWGPLNRSHRPIKNKKGFTFRKFVQQFEKLGYEVECKELIAADYGTPTMRKRFFLVARCDGQPIVWPEPTHGPRDSASVKNGIIKPYVGAHTQIDFSLPAPSIFDSAKEIKEKYGLCAKRPLAEKTMQRIARGLQRFVINNQEPFIVQVNHTGSDWHYCKSAVDPLPVVTAKHGFGIVAPTLIQYHSETAKGEVRGQDLTDPIMTVDSSNRYGLVTAFIQKYFDGGYKGAGANLVNPLPTITTVDHNSICTAYITQFNRNMVGNKMSAPINTITAGDGHYGEVRAFLIKYYGQGTGQDIRAPLDTITANDRFGLVTIHGIDYAIVDIGLRMLEPKELYGCQGFPVDYIIDRDIDGIPIKRAEQVKRCGNSVCPPLAQALVKANLPEMCTGERLPNMSIDYSQEQLRFA